ncbi:hypothetical protein ABID22_001828 [Pontibacter aydingkolensis]|uniref:Lipoprotein n=1 Tax=Pontibacter aydingkolensis TaxID=1911536 RepID=A0ABS7CPL2_9BACT|nr:hypothetical protein [Pontibacter aydingkolensis]MBW7465786.1 hypothetical protein [Pontibacter aydingkolensis]
MKSILCIVLLYLALSVLVISCTEADPEPACMRAEVVGIDCDSGWYILKLDESNSTGATGGGFAGQLQGGFVTTDNLPQAYQQPGLKLKVSLEINNESSPRCLATAVIYTPVKVVTVCESPGKY